MRSTGRLRFAASILGMGRAPEIVDRWPVRTGSLKKERKEIQKAAWLTILLVPVIALYTVLSHGWDYAIPGVLAAGWLGLVWDYAIRRHTFLVYYREFRHKYFGTGIEDFDCYAKLYWWRWQQLKWLFADRSLSSLVECVVILRVTEPGPGWRRDYRWQYDAVLEDRMDQYHGPLYAEAADRLVLIYLTNQL